MYILLEISGIMEAFAVVDNAGKTIYNKEEIEWEVGKITIAEKIKIASIHAGVPLVEIAKSFGISQSGFSQRMKTGKFTLEELERIAKIFGCEYVSFFRFDDDMKI